MNGVFENRRRTSEIRLVATVRKSYRNKVAKIFHLRYNILLAYRKGGRYLSHPCRQGAQQIIHAPVVPVVPFDWLCPATESSIPYESGIRGRWENATKKISERIFADEQLRHVWRTIPELQELSSLTSLQNIWEGSCHFDVNGRGIPAMHDNTILSDQVYTQLL